MSVTKKQRVKLPDGTEKEITVKSVGAEALKKAEAVKAKKRAERQKTPPPQS